MIPRYRLLFVLVTVQLFLASEAAKLLDTSVSCDQENYILMVNFDSTFRGIVYSEEGFPNCVYVNGSILPQRSYTLKIPLDGCETRPNNEGNLENSIIVQENVNYLQSTDKKYLLTCIVASPLGRSNDNAITVDFGGVTVDARQTTTETVTATMPPNSHLAAANLKYTVEIRAGHTLDAPSMSAPLNIGDPISYVVRLQKPVADSQIGRCWATDDKSSLELSDDHGCTLQTKGKIWTDFERIDNPSELVFINKIKAWAFPTSNEVNIFCNLRVCMSRSCAFTNCTSYTQPKARARRHGSDVSEVRVLSTKLRLKRQTSPTPVAGTISHETNERPAGVAQIALVAGCVTAFIVLIALLAYVCRPNRG